MSRAQIIESITSNCENRGTWIHPKLAIHFAMWISPAFSVEVISWVERFMRGDVTLVKDIIDRHDAINNTTSEVFITTLNNQLNEYKTNIVLLESANENLENISNSLQNQLEKLNEYRCSYCHKRYSSSMGLTRHLKNCSDKNMCEFKATIQFDKFICYFDLLYTYEIEGIHLKLIDWCSDKPKLSIKKCGKIYKFNVFLNESRWKVIKFLENDIDFPLELLLDTNSVRMFRENEKNYKRIYKSLTNEVDSTLEEEFKEKLGLFDNDED
jgi:hypothetical protein